MQCARAGWRLCTRSFFRNCGAAGGGSLRRLDSVSGPALVKVVEKIAKSGGRTGRAPAENTGAGGNTGSGDEGSILQLFSKACSDYRQRAQESRSKKDDNAEKVAEATAASETRPARNVVEASAR